MDPNQQQLLLGYGGGKKSTYIDDVFHTEVFVSPSQSSDYKVTNNIDNSGEGGMVWYKQRNGTSYHLLWDTERGSNKYIYSNSSSAESTGELLKSFDSDGYTIKTGTTLVDPARKNVLWNFRKAKGFFDVVKYTGTGSATTISHNLGSVPGSIFVKRTDGGNEDWVCYHRGISDILGNNPGHYYVYLNTTNGASQAQSRFNNVTATSTEFSVGTDNGTNGNGFSYVAYVFAGAGSTAATARSVAFDGDTDDLRIANNNDFDFGTNDFTIECWVFPNNIAYSSYYKRMWSMGSADNNSMTLNVADDGTIQFRFNNSSVISTPVKTLALGCWSHLAVVRESNTMKLYLNGVLQGTYSYTSSIDWSQAGESLYIGSQIGNTTSSWNGKISNFRIVKGTALYTTGFRPSTTPLTNITNTVVLCCNNSSTTGSTVTPGTITASGNPTASTVSPFDDPDCFTIGENEDQQAVKCGTYIGNQNATGPEVYLGWQPQWIILYPIGGGENWGMWDSMRTIVADGNDMRILPNDDGAEITNFDGLTLTPTGFKITSANHLINPNGTGVIYIAVRRPDSYVGKPPEVGTDVFAMDYGNASATIPSYDSPWPVDYGLEKYYTSNQSWWSSSRLTGTTYLFPDKTQTESSSGDYAWDSNVGYIAGTWANSTSIAYMWRRYAGMDVVTYTGTSASSATITHGLGRAPEMIWVKCRNAGHEWNVYHKGMNGGTAPENYFMYLDLTNAESNSPAKWNNTAPTAVNFSVSNHPHVYDNTNQFVAMLFASVEGISKCGSYIGNGTVGHTITVGFQPRFLIVKSATTSSSWSVFDTKRGWAAGNDKQLAIDSSGAEVTGTDFGEPTSTGFTINITGNAMNGSGESYIYFAHA